MRKYFYLLFVVFPVFLIAQKPTQEKEEYDFRETLWGMTKETVKRTEKTKPFQEVESQLIYIDTIINLKIAVFYDFIDNKLVSTGYAVMEDHSNENLYIKDYKKLKDALVEKYGKPSDKATDGSDYEEIVWLDDLYQDDPSRWGFAISVGDLIYQSFWETNTTAIVMRLFGDNYKISLLIKYFSKELEHLKEKEEQKEKLKNF